MYTGNTQLTENQAHLYPLPNHQTSGNSEESLEVHFNQDTSHQGTLKADETYARLLKLKVVDESGKLLNSKFIEIPLPNLTEQHVKCVTDFFKQNFRVSETTHLPLLDLFKLISDEAACLKFELVNVIFNGRGILNLLDQWGYFNTLMTAMNIDGSSMLNEPADNLEILVVMDKIPTLLLKTGINHRLDDLSKGQFPGHLFSNISMGGMGYRSLRIQMENDKTIDMRIIGLEDIQKSFEPFPLALSVKVLKPDSCTFSIQWGKENPWQNIVDCLMGLPYGPQTGCETETAMLMVRNMAKGCRSLKKESFDLIGCMSAKEIIDAMASSFLHDKPKSKNELYAIPFQLCAMAPQSELRSKTIWRFIREYASQHVPSEKSHSETTVLELVAKLICDDDVPFSLILALFRMMGWIHQNATDAQREENQDVNFRKTGQAIRVSFQNTPEWGFVCLDSPGFVDIQAIKGCSDEYQGELMALFEQLLPDSPIGKGISLPWLSDLPLLEPSSANALLSSVVAVSQCCLMCQKDEFSLRYALFENLFQIFLHPMHVTTRKVVLKSLDKCLQEEFSADLSLEKEFERHLNTRSLSHDQIWKTLINLLFDPKNTQLQIALALFWKRMARASSEWDEEFLHLGIGFVSLLLEKGATAEAIGLLDFLCKKKKLDQSLLDDLITTIHGKANSSVDQLQFAYLVKLAFEKMPVASSQEPFDSKVPISSLIQRLCTMNHAELAAHILMCAEEKILTFSHKTVAEWLKQWNLDVSFVKFFPVLMEKFKERSAKAIEQQVNEKPPYTPEKITNLFTALKERIDLSAELKQKIVDRLVENCNSDTFTQYLDMLLEEKAIFDEIDPFGNLFKQLCGLAKKNTSLISSDVFKFVKVLQAYPKFKKGNMWLITLDCAKAMKHSVNRAVISAWMREDLKGLIYEYQEEMRKTYWESILNSFKSLPKEDLFFLIDQWGIIKHIVKEPNKRLILLLKKVFILLKEAPKPAENSFLTLLLTLRNNLNDAEGQHLDVDIPLISLLANSGQHDLMLKSIMLFNQILNKNLQKDLYGTVQSTFSSLTEKAIILGNGSSASLYPQIIVLSYCLRTSIPDPHFDYIQCSEALIKIPTKAARTLAAKMLDDFFGAMPHPSSPTKKGNSSAPQRAIQIMDTLLSYSPHEVDFESVWSSFNKIMSFVPNEKAAALFEKLISAFEVKLKDANGTMGELSKWCNLVRKYIPKLSLNLETYNKSCELLIHAEVQFLITYHSEGDFIKNNLMTLSTIFQKSLPTNGSQKNKRRPKQDEGCHVAILLKTTSTYLKVIDEGLASTPEHIKLLYEACYTCMLHCKQMFGQTNNYHNLQGALKIYCAWTPAENWQDLNLKHIPRIVEICKDALDKKFFEKCPKFAKEIIPIIFEQFFKFARTQPNETACIELCYTYMNSIIASLLTEKTLDHAVLENLIVKTVLHAPFPYYINENTENEDQEINDQKFLWMDSMLESAQESKIFQPDSYHFLRLYFFGTEDNSCQGIDLTHLFVTLCDQIAKCPTYPNIIRISYILMRILPSLKIEESPICVSKLIGLVDSLPVNSKTDKMVEALCHFLTPLIIKMQKNVDPISPISILVNKLIKQSDLIDQNSNPDRNAQQTLIKIAFKMLKIACKDKIFHENWIHLYPLLQLFRPKLVQLNGKVAGELPSLWLLNFLHEEYGHILTNPAHQKSRAELCVQVVTDIYQIANPIGKFLLINYLRYTQAETQIFKEQDELFSKTMNSFT